VTRPTEAELAFWEKVAEGETRLSYDTTSRLLSEARAAARMRELLGEMEWIGSRGVGTGYCPCCEWWNESGHAPDCALAAELKGE